MNWTPAGTDWVCSPYRVCWGARGYSAWVYSRTESRCLGHGLATLKAAKILCEQHEKQVAA